MTLPTTDDPALRPFVDGRRLIALPAKAGRRQVVLAHLAAATFEPGVEYDEPAVNALLAPWCEGARIDHAALRRYLVEAGLMSRGQGVYRLGPGAEEGDGERLVRSIGLT